MTYAGRMTYALKYFAIGEDLLFWYGEHISKCERKENVIQILN